MLIGAITTVTRQPAYRSAAGAAPAFARATSGELRHGEERAHVHLVHLGPSLAFRDPGTGATRYGGPVAAHVRPACERWCASCRAWRPQEGVFSGAGGCPGCGRPWSEGGRGTGKAARPAESA